MKTLDFQGLKWQVVGKVVINLADRPEYLKTNYGCDMVIKDRTHYWMLNKIIDVGFEEIK